MLTCECDLIGLSPIGFSAPITSEKETGETHDAYELRTWREKMHVDASDEVFIPPMAIKNCLASVAQYLSEAVPGKGMAKYTKHFKSGIMVTEPLMLRVKGADVKPQRQFVPSDGKTGGGKRVWKHFPVLPTWKTHTTIIVLDPVLIDKPGKIEEYLGHAGKFIGLGWFRPERNGYFGRFEVKNFKATKSK